MSFINALDSHHCSLGSDIQVYRVSLRILTSLNIYFLRRFHDLPLNLVLLSSQSVIQYATNNYSIFFWKSKNPKIYLALSLTWTPGEGQVVSNNRLEQREEQLTPDWSPLHTWPTGGATGAPLTYDKPAQRYKNQKLQYQGKPPGEI